MLPLPAGREASSGGGAARYVRHRPEQTLLYQLIQEYYPAFKAHLAAQGTKLPGYVEREFGDYLNCGRLEQGFLRVSVIRSMRNISWLLPLLRDAVHGRRVYGGTR